MEKAIILNVNAYPPIGSQIAIYDGSSDVMLSESFEKMRTTEGITDIPSTLEGLTIQLAINLNRDYNTTGKYSITTAPGNRQIIIKPTNGSYNLSVINNSTNGAITIGSETVAGDTVLQSAIVTTPPAPEVSLVDIVTTVVNETKPVTSGSQPQVPLMDAIKTAIEDSQDPATNLTTNQGTLSQEQTNSSTIGQPIDVRGKLKKWWWILPVVVVGTYLVVKKVKK